MSWSALLGAAARELKPKRGDLMLAAGWFAVLVLAGTVWGLRLATGEGWISKGVVTLLGDSVPLDVVKDRDRPFAFDEVLPGAIVMSLLMATPIFVGLAVGTGPRAFSRAAWASIALTIPFMAIDAVNVSSPGLGDLGQAVGLMLAAAGGVITVALWILAIELGGRLAWDVWQRRRDATGGSG